MFAKLLKFPENEFLKGFTFEQTLFVDSRIMADEWNICLLFADNPSLPGQITEVEVMEMLTKILMGDISYRGEYFSALRTLLTCCCDLDRSLQRAYLSRVSELLIREAELVKEMSHKKPDEGR